MSAISLTIVKEVCRNRVDVHVKNEREEGTCWTISFSRLRTYGEKDCGAGTTADGGLRYYGVLAATHAVAQAHSRFSSFCVPLLSLFSLLPLCVNTPFFLLFLVYSLWEICLALSLKNVYPSAVYHNDHEDTWTCKFSCLPSCLFICRICYVISITFVLIVFF